MGARRCPTVPSVKWDRPNDRPAAPRIVLVRIKIQPITWRRFAVDSVYRKGAHSRNLSPDLIPLLSSFDSKFVDFAAPGPMTTRLPYLHGRFREYFGYFAHAL